MRILHIARGYYDAPVYPALFSKLEKYVDEYCIVPISIDREVKDVISNIKSLKCIYTIFRGLYFIKVNIMLCIIRKYIAKEKIQYDIIHAHFTFFDGDIALRLHKKNNVPYIVAVRGSDLILFKRSFFTKHRGLKILKNAEKIIFISNAHKIFFFDKLVPANKKKELEKKSYVINNGVDSFWLSNRYRMKSLNNEKTIKLLTTSDIDSNKNHQSVIAAAQEIIKLGYTIEYSVIGRIVEPEIHQKIIRNNIVRYIPTLKKESLIQYYREADIFVMPSFSETFGLSYIEAISQGIPVIYSQGHGIDGLFEEGAVGFHVNPHNPHNIAEIILKIINNYDEFRIDEINLTDMFSWDSIAMKYFSLYKKCLKND